METAKMSKAFADKLMSGTPPPKLIRDWTEEIEKRMKLYEFRITQRGGILYQKEVDDLVQMKLYKDTLYTLWLKDKLDEDKIREELKSVGYFQ